MGFMACDNDRIEAERAEIRSMTSTELEEFVLLTKAQVEAAHAGGGGQKAFVLGRTYHLAAGVLRQRRPRSRVLHENGG